MDSGGYSGVHTRWDSPICTLTKYVLSALLWQEFKKDARMECNKVNEKTLIKIENLETSSSDGGALEAMMCIRW